MATTVLTPPASPLRSVTDRTIALAVAALTFLLVYGVELSQFGLSIDEEYVTFHGDQAFLWLQQGRWGMSLVALVLPPIEAVPLVATVLFGAGLLVATWRAVTDFRLGRLSGVLFAAVHVGFPVWLHIVQFSTLAPGVGVGLAAAALGASLAVRGDRGGRLLAVVLIAFATGVYQTLGIYSVLYVLLHAHAEAVHKPDAKPAIGALLRTLAVAATVWAAGMVLYWTVHKASLAALSTQMTYVGAFIRLDQLQDDPAGATRTIALYLRSLLMGSHPMYIGWGAGILTLMWAGLAPWECLLRPREHAWVRWALALVVALAGFCVVAVPAIASVGALPIRAQVVLPLLAAWVASRIGLAEPVRIVRTGAWLLVGYFVIVSASISATLLYTDRVVHEADSALSQQLASRIRQVMPPSRPPGPLPVTLVGSTQFPIAGSLRKAELLGTSFYEHDSGNVHRVLMFMHLQGISGLEAVPFHTRKDLVPAVQAMPRWPADGSVQWTGGTMVIKLSEPTAAQTARR